MINEKITVRVTSTGQTLDVVVLSKRVDAIEVVLGEASTTCAASCIRRATAWRMPAARWDAKSSTSADARKSRPISSERMSAASISGVEERLKRASQAPVVPAFHTASH